MKGTAIMGADPDMALSFDRNTTVSGDTRHNIRPLGPYEDAGLNVYLGAFRTNKSGTNTNNGDYRDIYRVTGKTIADGSALHVELRFTERASFCVKPTNTPGNWFYLGLNTTDINVEEVYYQWNENTSSNTYATFFASTPYMVSSFFYRLLTDLVYVEDLYAAIEEAMSLLPMDSRYDPETYEAFLACLDETMNLYTTYNGVSQGSEGAAKASRKSVEAQALKLHSYISELRINASANEGQDGKEIRYFNANLYKWDAVNVNTAVHSLNDGQAEDHGFYFHGSTGAVTVPAYNTWNSTQHAEVMNLFHGVSNVNVQSFGIYSGLAAEDLTQATNPPFNNDILAVQGFWGEESIDNIVDVYNSVSVPFIYDPSTGYYTLNSDKYGVYFQGQPADGGVLSIADKPTVAYVSTSNFPDATNLEGKDGMRFYDAEARYCTGFQPFASMQYKTALGFSSDVDLETEGPSVIKGYLIGGLAQEANASEIYRYKYNNLGNMTWSAGMQLAVDFLMTEDGKVTTPDGSSREDAVFEFSGDDDVWVYIDDKLVLDLGGIHGEIEGVINFATGDVTVSSEKYNRVHDKNPNGYGQTAPEGITYTITEIDATQGANLHHGSVQNTVVNGVDLGKGVIYQKNLYTEVMKQSVSDFAMDGSHTLKIFYMDRGKGKTNCMIKFNLTSTDVLSVEKKIDPNYNGDGNKPISASTMSYLNELDFGFTLTRDTAPVAYYPYSIFDKKGAFVGSGETDRMGHFTLKNGLRAEFANLQFEGQDYLLTEDTYDSTPESSKINPYMKLQWRASNCATSDASERTNLSVDTLTSGKWVTVTLKIPKENRNLHSIMGIRPYFGGLESLSPEQQGQLYVDYIYIGPDDRPDQVYGYDSHYNDDTTYSDGTSLFVEGSGVKTESNTEKYTEASFTFTGTGFDIISRTGAKQATIRLEVKNSKGTVVKSMTVNNKGELELYQIPIVSVQGLTHGTYTVTHWVNQAVDSGFAFLQRGGEFYFDAVRIYNPINATHSVTPVQKTANKNYKLDREAFQRIKEIRNILLTKPEFDALSDTVEGAVFVDVNSSNVYPDTGTVENPSTDYYTTEVETYNKIGPKNEVYLAPNQAVAFNLKVSTNTMVASLDIGAKTIDGSSGTLKIGILAMDENRQMTIETYQTVNISSSTAQYWELDLTGVQFKAKEDGYYQPLYLVFYNTSSVKSNASVSQSVISLTDVKLGFMSSPAGEMDQDSSGDTEIQKRNAEEPEEGEIFFQVDGNTIPATEAFIHAVSKTETPLVDNGTRILHSLDLAADISLNYAVPKADLAGYDSFYLECEIPVYTQQGHMEDEPIRIEGREVGEFYYFTLQGLTAVQMNDSITAQLHMFKGVEEYYTAVDTYSIASYALAQLNKNSASDPLKTLCADLLVYGAKAQLYKDYRTDSLVDSLLTRTHRDYLSDLEAVSFGNVNLSLSDHPAPTVSWAGKALDLNYKVGIKYILNLGAYQGKLEDLSLHLSYVDMDGQAQTVVLTELEEYRSDVSLYSFTFDGLLAAELRSSVTAQVYCKDQPASVSLRYSPDTYGNNKTGTLGDLCKALFAYSDSAKIYFAE